MLLNVEFNVLHHRIPVVFKALHSVGMAKADPYTGSYEITPTFDEQTLETTGKLMSDNVKVFAIPVERVANTAGGYTIIVGG